MKKIKIIIVNILLAFILLFFTEFSLIIYEVYQDVSSMLKNDIQYRENFSFKDIKNSFKNKTDYLFRKTFIKINEFRKVSGAQYEEKYAILLGGCSFTFGEHLSDSETFGYVLSEYIKNPVYNWGLAGGSPKEFLYILKNENYRNSLIKNHNNVKYVIYTYITDQKDRLYYNKFRPATPSFYLNDRNELTEDKSFMFIKKSNIYKYVNKLRFPYYTKKETFDLYCAYMSEINKTIKKYFDAPNSTEPQLIILVYQDDDKEDWKKLEEENIMVLKVNDLVNTDINLSEYRTFDNWHPNKKAWELIVPELVKKLSL